MFKPEYTLTPQITNHLMKIEAYKQAIVDLPMTARIQKSLRETARLQSIHYSTQIEGNRLTLAEAEQVIKKNAHFPGRERDEKEVIGYYRALDEIKAIVNRSKGVKENTIQRLHGLVMAGSEKKITATPYRDGQNVIRDSESGAIVYMPPEAKDVPFLMKDLANWINTSIKEELPCPLIAGISHYQFATIHPYYDGNGRTARLLTTLIMHIGGYGLKGFYSLDEYYAKNLRNYYHALDVGTSHNYYMGRAEADITNWIDYFCKGTKVSFEKIVSYAKEAALKGESDQSQSLRSLDTRQRKVLDLFYKSDWITSHDVAELFGLQPRTARETCQKWSESGFFVILDESKKNRKYGLSESVKKLVRS